MPAVMVTQAPTTAIMPDRQDMPAMAASGATVAVATAVTDRKCLQRKALG